MTGTIELCADRETRKKRQLDSTSRDPAQRTKAVGNSGNFQLSGPHRLSHGADSRNSPRPVCLCSHMSLCHALSQRVSPAGNQKVLTVWGDDMETGDCLQRLWFGAEQDARADDAVQEMARQKMEVALHRDYCKLQVPYRAVEPRIGGYATLPCLVCDMPAATVHTQYIQLGLVNFNPRICRT